MPGSIEAYYQEIGRAGRDGLPSLCLLLFNYADRRTHEFFIEGSYPSKEIVQDVYDALIETGLKRIELSASEIARRADVRNDMAVQTAIYLLERAGHLERTLSPGYRASENETSYRSGQGRFRSIVMLDSSPAPKLRVDFSDLRRREASETRKLREMIEFGYTRYCYRGRILDYFGDRRPWRQCGACGNCEPTRASRSLSYSRSARAAAPPVLLTPRALTEDEALRVRKILACAARMKGRFGKQLLAATLRGSAAKNVMQARLNELSTYGLLKEMKKEELIDYIEALVTAGCLEINGDVYPTVFLTEAGERVMREQDRVELALAETRKKPVSEEELSGTAEQTYALYCRGLSVSEIAQERNFVVSTIEGHLLDCMRADLSVDTSRLVSASARALIEQAIATHGTEKLKPLRESLPEEITYNMIRFVVADQVQAEKRGKRRDGESGVSTVTR
jgi:ATP-dependent DNA helicase RecQ